MEKSSSHAQEPNNKKLSMENTLEAGAGEVVRDNGGKFKPKLWPQLLAVLAANMGAIAYGTVVSWSATGFPSLEKDPDFPDYSLDDLSWMSSAARLSSFVVCIPAGLVVERFGRKTLMLLLTIPFLAGWALMYFSYNVWMMIGGRFLTGLGSGGYTFVAPLYIAEISEAKYRGMFIAGFDILTGVGMLYVLVLGKYINWKNQVLACGFVPVIGFILTLLVPESPRHLLSKGLQTKGVKSLCWLRGATESRQINGELVEIMQSFEENKTESFKDLLQYMKSPPVRRAAILGFFLFNFQLLTGITAVLSYTVYIFESADVYIDEYDSSIIIGAVGILPGLLASFAVDRFGRRPLLLISEALLVISLVTLGAFFNVKESHPEFAAEKLGWLPLVVLILYSVGFAGGIGPVVYIMVPEILPQNARGPLLSILTFWSWLGAFLVSRFFYNLLSGLGDDGGYWFFAGVCLLGFLFILFFVPETKGKTLEEIQQDIFRH